jgi:hypothetical protein
MDVDPDAAITDSQNATTAHFVFVPRVRKIRKKHAVIGATVQLSERLGDDLTRRTAALRGWIAKK